MREKNRQVMKNILYAVETGGQVYGCKQYDCFVEAYTNSSAEHAITIGAGGWYGTEAKRLLSLIRDTDPSGWDARDTDKIGIDLDTAVWSTYKVAKGSKKALCIQSIINSAVGIACQDSMMIAQIKEKEASITKKYGDMPDGAMMECINIQHQGGANALARILKKTERPLTAASIYAALCTDPDDKTNNNQVGDYVSRQKKVYEMIRIYEEREEDTMTEAEQRKAVVNWLAQYKGISEGSAQHKAILKVFNDSGLCKRYKMTIYDAWCAASASAAFIANGLGSIFPVECSCWYIINYAKQRGIWVENDAYVPKVGDAVLYDWQDSGSGDNQGNPDHIGLVYSVSGNTMTIVEGNMNNTVGFRNLQVNGKYIRGFVTPKYTGTKEETKKADTKPSTPTTPTTVKEVKATKSASHYNKAIAGAYKTTTDLNMRNGAGTGNKILTTLKGGVKVRNYGYYSEVGGVKWLYVQVTVNNVKYTGFCSSKYLKKS